MNIPGTEKCLVLYFWHPMLVRPVMKRLFRLKAKNSLGRFAPSALPHYNTCIIHPINLVTMYNDSSEASF